MSAWLCEQGTLSIVTSVIKSNEWKEEFGETFYNSMEDDKLNNVLNIYNRRNLDYLYSDGADGFGTVDTSYKKMDVNTAQRVKSVACYLYQTMDYNDNRDEYLLKLLEKWLTHHRHDCTEHEWDQAEWDIDNPINDGGK